MKKIYLLQKCFIVSIGFLLCNYFAPAQTNIFPSTGSAGIGTTTPNAYSILDMVSTSKGILIPRMTFAQRNAIAVLPAVPATGLLIYQTNSTPGFYYYSGTGWKAITPKAGWLLTGNASTDPATNFIGTTDAQPLVLKVNNHKAGYLDYNGGLANTGFGYLTLNSITTGQANTAIGYNVLSRVTSGGGNTATGNNVLAFDTSGGFNTVSGFNALGSNTSGGFNTANGAFTLGQNTTGSDNTADGSWALLSNTTGYSNVAVGSHALFNNTIISNIVAVGDSALYNQNGFGFGLNTAVGSKALYSNTEGWQNTANGFQTLYSNTLGSDNTATGSFALYLNTEGHDNTAAGSYALYDNTGKDNTGIGAWALYSNKSGYYNTAVGYSADVDNDGYFNSSAFGYLALITASNQVRIGNASISSIGGYKAWTNLSDGRVKKNIKENVPGLAFINLLKPITYNLDLDAADKILQRPVIKDRNGKPIQPSPEQMNARNAQQQIVCTGFIAQDVEATAKKIGYDFDGVDAAKNDKDLYGLRYSEFVVPLVKAVQELSAKNDELEVRLQKLETLLANQSAGNQTTSNIKPQTSNFSLDQNVPNPFSRATTIKYSLPQKYSSAKIIVVDESGKTIKIFNLSGTGKGTVNFSSPFSVGASYQYSLFVDGKLIDTKQMELIR